MRRDGHASWPCPSIASRSLQSESSSPTFCGLTGVNRQRICAGPAPPPKSDWCLGRRASRGLPAIRRAELLLWTSTSLPAVLDPSKGSTASVRSCARSRAGGCCVRAMTARAGRRAAASLHRPGARDGCEDDRSKNGCTQSATSCPGCDRAASAGGRRTDRRRPGDRRPAQRALELSDAGCERARDVDGGGESCTWVGRFCERHGIGLCGGSLRRRSRLARVFGTSRAGLSGAAADDLEAAVERQSATRSSAGRVRRLALAQP